ncbi:hypothetical protein TIFTF001_017883 [Ficus carica]|uniref:RNase H type-1 domain-containing protein n=1 Tax=Ficus carica TaxID=3494 RepID=A0AA88DJ43_FICCA|nr:hypothetical protein TIFTF001_017883 [Ficus carica]
MDDELLYESKEFIGLGLVARDENGVVLGAVARQMFGTFSPYFGECMAVREDVWFAQSRGFSSWIVETDVLNIVHVIDDSAHRSVEANVIDDVCDVLFSYEGIFVKADLPNRI